MTPNNAEKHCVMAVDFGNKGKKVRALSLLLEENNSEGISATYQKRG
jgi:hypothetical protein